MQTLDPRRDFGKNPSRSTQTSTTSTSARTSVMLFQTVAYLSLLTAIGSGASVTTFTAAPVAAGRLTREQPSVSQARRSRRPALLEIRVSPCGKVMPAGRLASSICQRCMRMAQSATSRTPTWQIQARRILFHPRSTAISYRQPMAHGSTATTG